MEKSLKIKLSENFFLYGKFSGFFNRPLIIIAHGFLGNMDEDLYYSAARWFEMRKFSTFRFNFYGHQKDARQLMNCTLKIHGADIDAVIRYFRKRGVKKIFIVGHSFSGPAIFCSHDQNFDGAVLWDPSYKISFIKSSKDFPGGKYIKEINGYLMKWGINLVIGKAMAEEIDSLQWDLMTNKFKVPFKVIIAEKGVLKGAKKYLNGAKVEKDLIIMKNATHYFTNKEAVREKVFKISEKWFRKFINTKK